MSENLTKIVSIDGQATDLQKQLNELLEDKKFCDVTLVSDIDGRKVEAHMVVLAAASNYLKSLIKVKLAESPVNQLHLYVSGSALASLVKYFYSGSIELQQSTVQELYAAALLWQVNPVIDACCNFMLEIINTNNCFELLSFAKSKGFDALMQNIRKYIQKHFEMIFQEDLCLTLEFDDLLYILQDDLEVSNHEMVFKAMQRWINHDKAEREKHIDELVPAIQLPLLSMEFIWEHVEPFCNTLKSKAACLNAIKCKYASNLSQTADDGANDEFLLAISGDRAPSGFFKMAVLCTETNKWYNLENNVPFRGDCRLTTFNSKVIIAGGQRTDSVISMDLKTLKCDHLQPLTKKRSNFSICVIGENIYVIGGKDANRQLNNIECFNSSTNKWSVIHEETEFDIQCGTAFKDKLYIVLKNKPYTYGHPRAFNNNWCPIQKVKCLDTHNHTWTEITVIPESMDNVEKCVVNGRMLHLFCMDHNHVVYDFETKTLTQHGRASVITDNLHKTVPVFQNEIVAFKSRDGSKLYKYNQQTKHSTELPSYYLMQYVDHILTVKRNMLNWSVLKSNEITTLS